MDALGIFIWTAGVIFVVVLIARNHLETQAAEEETLRKNRAAIARETSAESKATCQHCGQHISFPAAMRGEVIECPHCKIQTRLVTVEPPYIPPPKIVPPPEPDDIGFSQFMIFCGLVGLVYFGFFFEIGNGGVANLGLMSDRLNGVLASAAVAVLGALFIIIRRLGILIKK